MNAHDLATQAAAVLHDRTGIDGYALALTLGSGWKSAAHHIGELVADVPAEDIAGFRSSPVPGHHGSLQALRTPSGAHVLVIGARTHFYEGHGVDAVVHGVRTAATAGARTMVLTNGAGGLRSSWAPGQPVLISDHINLTAHSPLLGARFIDLTDAYSTRLRALARTIDPTLDEGVYVQLPGPHYETPAEIQMIGRLGGDMVGMSTALETIAAREAGMEVLGISLITNLAAGIQDTALDHQEVLDAGRDAEHRLGPLLAAIVAIVTTKTAA